MKRKFFILTTFAFCCFGFFLGNGAKICFASNESVEDQLKEETASQIDDLNFSEFQEILNETDTSSVNVFSNFSFKKIVEKIVDGEITFGFSNFFSSIFSAFGTSLKKLLPTLSIILSVILLCSLFMKIRPSLSENQVGSVIFFACFAIVIVLISKLCGEIVVQCGKNLTSIKRQMQISFPILLTLMTAVGGVASVKIYQPSVAILAGGISTVFIGVLLPLFSIAFILSIVGHLSDNVKLDKFVDLVNSIFKWIIGIIFTVFMAYLAVQGMTASSVDGVSIRTAKYAIKNYVPVLGGYISDGFGVVVASSMLLKNGIGLASLFLLLSTVIAPILNIIVLSIGLKLVAALVQPVCDPKFSSFLSSVSKNLNMLVAVLLGASLMYFLTIALMIGTANNLV